jgi:hypothetical protein
LIEATHPLYYGISRHVVERHIKDSSLSGKHFRFALILPVCAILVTSALWLGAHSQYQSSCLDCVPIALQLAGMLNSPIALLAYPFYPLIHGDVSLLHLAVLLVAIALQWVYIGYVIDNRHMALRRRTLGRCIAGTLGMLLAFGPLIVAIRMYHWGPLYKSAALLWFVLMAYHFSGFFRNGQPADSSVSVSS